MKWKPLVAGWKRVVSQPDSLLLIELASAAMLLAWVTHRVAE